MAFSSISAASLLGTQIVGWHYVYIIFAAVTVLSTICCVFVVAFRKPKIFDNIYDYVAAFGRFFYASFLKPHSGDESTGQQAALESFYKAQVRTLVACYSRRANYLEKTGWCI